jgi:hypothetical protein
MLGFFYTLIIVSLFFLLMWQTSFSTYLHTFLTYMSEINVTLCAALEAQLFIRYHLYARYSKVSLRKS